LKEPSAFICAMAALTLLLLLRKLETHLKQRGEQ
jgi:hypothetical protein